MTYPDVRVYLDFTSDAYDGASGWVDVTDYAQDITCQYGRSSLLDEFQPGSGSVTLLNDDGRFDPTNASGPYYPDLRPRNRVMVQASFDENLVTQTWASQGSWTTFGSGGVTVSAGAVNIVSSTAVDNRGVYLDLDRFEDLNVEVAFTITATPWPSPAIFYPLYLRLTDDDQNAVYFFASGGTIGAVVFRDGAGTGVWSTTYNASTHASVRILRVGTTVHFDTYNGSGWTTQATAEVALATSNLPRLYHRVETSDTSATTDTLSVGTTTVNREAIHSVAYGWVDGWPVHQDGRKHSTVTLTWHDALSVLARAPLPDSVWDYLIESHVAAAPFLWWKLGSESSIEVDASGNGRDGRYIVYEGVVEPWSAENLPASIVADAAVDQVIPTSGRPGKSWAKLQAAVGQPVGGPTGKFPRTPSLTSSFIPEAFAADRNFSFECWGVFRQAFPLDASGSPSSLTPMYQPLFTMGQAGVPGHLEFGVKGDAKPYAGYFSTSWGDLTFDGAPDLTDGQPHHLFFRSTNNGGNMEVRVYVDGTQVTASGFTFVNLGAITPPGSNWSVVVGQGLRDPDDRGLQSTLGDVLVYDGIISASVITANYNAGKYGALTGTELTSGEAVSQVLTMLGWGSATDVDDGVKVVTAGPMKGRNALEVMREFAAAERAPLYQAPNGFVTMLPRFWQVELPRAASPAWALSDASGGTLGYSELDFAFDDRSIINHAEVAFADGDQTVENDSSITRYGRFDANSGGTRLTNSADAKALAEWLVNSYGEPRRRVDRPLAVEPVSGEDFSFVLGVQFGTRVTLTRTTVDARTVADDYWVQGVRHRIAPGRLDWLTEITLERADDPYRIFTLAGPGSHPGSPLDGDDVLGF